MRAARHLAALAVPLMGLLLAVPATTRAQSSKVGPLLREAQQAMEAEDYRAAERYLRQAVTADPRSPEAACGLGQVQMALKQYHEAVRSLEDCKGRVLDQLRQQQEEQIRSLGSIETEIREVRDTISAIRQGRIKGAGVDRITALEARLRDLELMKSSGPVRIEVPPQISFTLGTAYLQVGRLEEAERELLTVLRTNPNSGEAHNNLATVYLAEGRFEEAAERVRLAESAGARVSPQMKADIAARHSPGVPSGAPVRQPRTTRAEDEPVAIQHQGRTCAANGVFVRLEATVTPSWGVHDPIVRFRSEEAAGWYAVTMLPSGGDSFATTVPKPRGAKSFEYFIEVSGYDETETRTDEFQVTVVDKMEECAEAAADSKEAGGVLIVDVPRDIADPPPVPPGFSIRGTANDIGVLEIGKNKALIAGGVALAGVAAYGIAAASKPPEAYVGPEPFVDSPGIAFVASNPPPGSTLSLSSGTLSLELRIYSPETLMGAKIVAQLAASAFSSASCIVLRGTHDLQGGRAESVVLSGPTQPTGGNCDTRVPLEHIWVRVTAAGGIGGFGTGNVPLRHLDVVYYITE